MADPYPPATERLANHPVPTVPHQAGSVVVSEVELPQARMELQANLHLLMAPHPLEVRHPSAVAFLVHMEPHLNHHPLMVPPLVALSENHLHPMVPLDHPQPTVLRLVDLEVDSVENHHQVMVPHQDHLQATVLHLDHPLRTELHQVDSVVESVADLEADSEENHHLLMVPQLNLPLPTAHHRLLMEHHLVGSAALDLEALALVDPVLVAHPSEVDLEENHLQATALLPHHRATVLHRSHLPRTVPHRADLADLALVEVADLEVDLAVENHPHRMVLPLNPPRRTELLQPEVSSTRAMAVTRTKSVVIHK